MGSMATSPGWLCIGSSVDDYAKIYDAIQMEAVLSVYKFVHPLASAVGWYRYGRLVWPHMWGEGRMRMLQDCGILNIRALLQYAAFVRCPYCAGEHRIRFASDQTRSEAPFKISELRRLAQCKHTRDIMSGEFRRNDPLTLFLPLSSKIFRY